MPLSEEDTREIIQKVAQVIPGIVHGAIDDRIAQLEVGLGQVVEQLNQNQHSLYEHVAALTAPDALGEAARTAWMRFVFYEAERLMQEMAPPDETGDGTGDEAGNGETDVEAAKVPPSKPVKS